MKAQISLRICAGWSGHSLSAYRIIQYQNNLLMNRDAFMKLRGVQRLVRVYAGRICHKVTFTFSHCGSYNIVMLYFTCVITVNTGNFLSSLSNITDFTPPILNCSEHISPHREFKNKTLSQMRAVKSQLTVWLRSTLSLTNHHSGLHLLIECRS